MGNAWQSKDKLGVLVQMGTALMRCARAWGMTETQVDALLAHCKERANSAPSPEVAND